MKLLFVGSCLAGAALASMESLKKNWDLYQNRTGGDGFRKLTGRDPFQEIENSGCWCYLTSLKGRSRPVSEVDAVCQELQRGYECAVMEIEDNGGCVPWEQNYFPVIGNLQPEDDFVDVCFAANRGGIYNGQQMNDLGECAYRTCVMETFFQERLGVVYDGPSFNAAHLHANGFDVDEECPKSSGYEIVGRECCGTLPNRTPFNTGGGLKACCGDVQTFLTDFECCDESSKTVAAIGEC